MRPCLKHRFQKNPFARIFTRAYLWKALVGISLLTHAAERPQSEALAPRSQGGPGFERLNAAQTGIAFQAPLLPDHPKNYLYYSGFACGGVAIGDFNGDETLDLFFASGPGANALYLQSTAQSFQFRRAPDTAGIAGGNAWGSGVAAIDIDGDRDLDLLVCHYDASPHLYLNETLTPEQPRFREAAAEFGLTRADASMMPTFADYDRDGDLDLYILNNQYYRPNGRPNRPPFKMVNGRPTVLPEFARYYNLRKNGQGQFTMDTYGRPDLFFRNNGANAEGQITFTDITTQAGIQGTGHGLSATWWDYNQDGYPDLYVGNDFTDPDRLYRNNQNGTFTEVLGQTLPYCSWSSMGATSADFNNDGLPDFFSADMAATTHFQAKISMGDMSKHRWLMENGWPRQHMRNMLYINTGTDHFMETAWLSGVAQSDWTWAAKAADFDNDGWVDLFLSNGMARNFSDADIPLDTNMLIGRTVWDIYRDTPAMPQRNLAFRNEGGLRFAPAEDWGLNDVSMSYATAWGDLDQDGDLDLIVVNLDEEVGVYRNHLSNGAALIVRLRGNAPNSQGIGARVELLTDQGRQVRFVNPSQGFLSQNAPEVHYGLASSDRVQSLTVRWPSGHVQTFQDLKANRRYTINEPSSNAAPTKPNPAKPKPLYAEVAQEQGLTFRHRERTFNDYQKQPLLPGKLSQLGPGHAWGDADGDGRDDLYVGGAAGQTGQLYRHLPDGRFAPVPGPWQQNALSEDMGCLWLDADRDGDLDLYVGSGSVEVPAGSRYLEDRLYLNQGQFQFSPAAKGVLPHGAHSTGPVVGGDFDGDNDIDLFIGARSLPGQFPLAPKSHLLRNDSTPGQAKFTDITASHADALTHIGLVTGALWSDVDRDGALDLLVALEWGSVRLFHNRDQKLTDQSGPAGLEERTGWWQGISSADIDHDGDLDYLIGNVGWNTKYGRASLKKPASLYFGDMDGTGTPRLVEAKPDGKDALPIRGFSCSANAIPSLKGKFDSFRAFASAGLTEIYTPKRLDASHQYLATAFESGVILNQSTPGKPRFAWQPLPDLAQASPIYGMLAVDATGDGQNDIFAVGNHYTREPETGLWRGTPGTFLRGQTSQPFAFEMPSTSGLIAPNDTKSLSTVDFNQDGRPDFLAAENNGRLRCFENQSTSDRFLAIRLKGPKGNRPGYGARVALVNQDGSRTTSEITAGSSYLSQSAPIAFFGLGPEAPKQIQVNWPDGDQQTVSLESATSSTITIAHP